VFHLKSRVWPRENLLPGKGPLGFPISRLSANRQAVCRPTCECAPKATRQNFTAESTDSAEDDTRQRHKYATSAPVNLRNLCERSDTLVHGLPRRYSMYRPAVRSIPPDSTVSSKWTLSDFRIAARGGRTACGQQWNGIHVGVPRTRIACTKGRRLRADSTSGCA